VRGEKRGEGYPPERKKREKKSSQRGGKGKKSTSPSQKEKGEKEEGNFPGKKEPPCILSGIKGERKEGFP